MNLSLLLDPKLHLLIPIIPPIKKSIVFNAPILYFHYGLIK